MVGAPDRVIVGSWTTGILDRLAMTDGLLAPLVHRMLMCCCSNQPLSQSTTPESQYIPTLGCYQFARVVAQSRPNCPHAISDCPSMSQVRGNLCPLRVFQYTLTCRTLRLLFLTNEESETTERDKERESPAHPVASLPLYSPAQHLCNAAPPFRHCKYY